MTNSLAAKRTNTHKDVIILALAKFTATQLTHCFNSYTAKLCTVKPPNKGHIGDGLFVPCREVVLFSVVFFLNLLESPKGQITNT